MKQVASELLLAQRLKNPLLESKAIHALFGRCKKTKSVNQHTALPMPERLLSKVAYGFSDCWTFIGALTSDGYGILHGHGEKLAHRASYKEFCGSIPQSMMVLHKCDNPMCVNPEHLFVGTHADNMRDMKNKGRAHRPIGSKNPKSKINSESASQIRLLFASGESTKSLALKFPISQSSIYRIIRGTTWN